MESHVTHDGHLTAIVLSCSYNKTRWRTITLILCSLGHTMTILG
jgi:hypothetical protein